jgi:ArsR family transcriptional regulator
MAHMPTTFSCEPKLLKRQSAIFKALGHPARLSIVLALAHHERCVCELHAGQGTDLSTTSRHLSVLVSAGILSCDKRANKVFYQLAMSCVLPMITCIAKTLDQGAV